MVRCLFPAFPRRLRRNAVLHDLQGLWRPLRRYCLTLRRMPSISARLGDLSAIVAGFRRAMTSLANQRPLLHSGGQRTGAGPESFGASGKGVGRRAEKCSHRTILFLEWAEARRDRSVVRHGAPAPEKVFRTAPDRLDRALLSLSDRRRCSDRGSGRGQGQLIEGILTRSRGPSQADEGPSGRPQQITPRALDHSLLVP